MTGQTVGCAKTSSIADVNRVVTQQEQLLGPLIQIGNDGNQTVLTFNLDEDPPTKFAVVAAGSTVPAGSTKVCTGTIFVNSTLTSCIATRPN